jgi:hypothetical protein
MSVLMREAGVYEHVQREAAHMVHVVKVPERRFAQV